MKAHIFLSDKEIRPRNEVVVTFMSKVIMLGGGREGGVAKHSEGLEKA